MIKLYCLFLVGLMFLAFAVPAIAVQDEAIPVAGFQRAPVPLSPGLSAACGPVIYDNTGGTYFYSTTAPKWNVLDDGAFPAGTAPVCLGCVEYAWYQQVAETLFVVVDFWDTVIPGGPVCNATWLGGFYTSWGLVPVGGWLSGSIDVSSLPTIITFPDDNWAVQIRYYKSITPLTVSTRACVFFANGPIITGSGDTSVYWRDASGNGAFECPTEARGFAPPNMTQFYLKLSATEFPSAVQPSTWGTIKAFYR